MKRTLAAILALSTGFLPMGSPVAYSEEPVPRYSRSTDLGRGAPVRRGSGRSATLEDLRETARSGKEEGYKKMAWDLVLSSNNLESVEAATAKGIEEFGVLSGKEHTFTSAEDYHPLARRIIESGGADPEQNGIYRLHHLGMEKQLRVKVPLPDGSMRFETYRNGDPFHSHTVPKEHAADVWTVISGIFAQKNYQAPTQTDGSVDAFILNTLNDGLKGKKASDGTRLSYGISSIEDAVINARFAGDNRAEIFEGLTALNAESNEAQSLAIWYLANFGFNAGVRGNEGYEVDIRFIGIGDGSNAVVYNNNKGFTRNIEVLSAEDFREMIVDSTEARQAYGGTKGWGTFLDFAALPTATGEPYRPGVRGAMRRAIDPIMRYDHDAEDNSYKRGDLRPREEIGDVLRHVTEALVKTYGTESAQPPLGIETAVLGAGTPLHKRSVFATMLNAIGYPVRGSPGNGLDLLEAQLGADNKPAVVKTYQFGN